MLHLARLFQCCIFLTGVKCVCQIKEYLLNNQSV